MKITNILLLIIVLGGTLALFFLLGPSVKTDLFYINLGFTLLLELILFGTIVAISGKKLFNMPNTAAAVQISRFVIFATIIIIAFNVIRALTGEEILDDKWYFGALILLTIIYAIIIIFTIQGGQSQLQMRDEISEVAEFRIDLNIVHCELSNLFTNKSSALSVDYAILKECKNNIRLIGDKIGMISTLSLRNNSEKVQEIADDIIFLKREVDQINVSDDKDESEKLLQSITNQASIISGKINMLTRI